jgi:hypothetical protein
MPLAPASLVRASSRLSKRAAVLGRFRRRREPDTSRFMDYGPDWPPVPRQARLRHPLLRRCVAAVVLYALIWAFGSVLLELRLYQLRDLGNAPVTTYTTISPHHGHG